MVSLHNDPNCLTSRCSAAHLVISLGLSLSSNPTYCPTETLTFCPLTSLLPQINAPGQIWDSRQIQTIKSFIPIDRPQNKIEYHSPCSRVCRTFTFLCFSFDSHYIISLIFEIFFIFFLKSSIHPSIFNRCKLSLLKLSLVMHSLVIGFIQILQFRIFPHGGSSYLGRCLPDVLRPLL